MPKRGKQKQMSSELTDIINTKDEKSNLSSYTKDETSNLCSSTFLTYKFFSLKSPFDSFISYYDTAKASVKTNVIDPISDEWKSFSFRPIDSLQKYVTLGLAIIISFMLWKGIMLYTKSASPVVVVLSGSMEPAFKRGDILFLNNINPPKIGDVVVFEINGRDIPIVHRLISIHKTENATQYLTKGDNNKVDDRGLYANDDKWLCPDKMLGQAVGKVPYIGYFTIWLNDNPPIKWGVLAFTFLMMLSGNN